MPQVKIHDRFHNDYKEVYHVIPYVLKIETSLKDFLIKNDIDAKIHYPIPMHLQKASKKYGYKKGDFPKAEEIANTTLSLPVHEFITQDQLKFMSKKVKEFYS